MLIHDSAPPDNQTHLYLETLFSLIHVDKRSLGAVPVSRWEELVKLNVVLFNVFVHEI